MATDTSYPLPFNEQCPDIRYTYTKTGQVDIRRGGWYPKISTKTAYSYSPRKWLDTLIATKGSADIFKQFLDFDDAGQIVSQTSQQGTSAAFTQAYEYDDLGQLTKWIRHPGTGSEASELYSYDSVGNRTVLDSKNNLGQTTSWSLHDIGRRTSISAGPNQLLKTRRFAPGLGMTDYTEYEYDPDGATKKRELYSTASVLQLDETFKYSSWRGLSWEYQRTDPNLISGRTFKSEVQRAEELLLPTFNSKVQRTVGGGSSRVSASGEYGGSIEELVRTVE